jgi:hypothetical protein
MATVLLLAQNLLEVCTACLPRSRPAACLLKSDGQDVACKHAYNCTWQHCAALVLLLLALTMQVDSSCCMVIISSIVHHR